MYNNAKYGWSISAAPGWEADEQTDRGITLRAADPKGYILVQVYDLRYNYSLQEFAEFHRDFLVEYKEDAELFEILSFDRVRDERGDFYRLEYREQTWSGLSAFHIVEIIALSKDYPSKPYGYIVIGTMFEDRLGEHGKERDAMLDSFRW